MSPWGFVECGSTLQIHLNLFVTPCESLGRGKKKSQRHPRNSKSEAIVYNNRLILATCCGCSVIPFLRFSFTTGLFICKNLLFIPLWALFMAVWDIWGVVNWVSVELNQVNQANVFILLDRSEDWAWASCFLWENRQGICPAVHCIPSLSHSVYSSVFVVFFLREHDGP